MTSRTPSNRRQRVFPLVLLVALGCKDTAQSSGSNTAVESSSPASRTSAEAWDRIARLADPETTIDPDRGTQHLERALEISSEHIEAWRMVSLEDSEASIEQFAEAQSVLTALQQWAAQGGGLLPVGPDDGRNAIFQVQWVELASKAATKEDHEALDAIERLGRLQVSCGRNLLEATRGAHALDVSSRRLEELGVSRDRTGAPGPEQLARILAAEAVQSKSKMDELRTDESARRKAEQAIEALDVETKNAAAKLGVELGPPDEAQMAAVEAFWVEALEGATRGEPAEETLLRLRSAAQRCEPSCRKLAQTTVSVAERLVDQLTHVTGDG